MITQHFLLAVVGDVEPELTGPFPNDEALLNEARAHRHQDPSLRDGLYRLTLTAPEGATLEVAPFSGGELED